MPGTSLSQPAVDHVLILVHDLDRSKADLERLGFIVADRGVHTKDLGTANHCIILERDYFELLAVVTPTDRNAPFRKRLESHEGVVGFALATDDADAVREAYLARDLEISPVLDYGRPMMIDGCEQTVAFKSTSMSRNPAVSPVMFYCQHLTPHLVWRKEWQHHPNTAKCIAGLTFAADDPERTARDYRDMFAPDAEIDGDAEARTFRVGQATVRILSRERAVREHPQAVISESDPVEPVGLAIGVADLAKARAVLSENGVDVSDGPDRIRIPPQAACGTPLDLMAV